jgi:hypothetical protein
MYEKIAEETKQMFVKLLTNLRKERDLQIAGTSLPSSTFRRSGHTLPEAISWASPRESRV